MTRFTVSYRIGGRWAAVLATTREQAAAIAASLHRDGFLSATVREVSR